MGKNRGLLGSYFFKVIIVNSEFQTYLLWFCEPLNYLYVYKDIHVHMWHINKLYIPSVEIFTHTHTLSSN